jgi:alpha-mannosidase
MVYEDAEKLYAEVRKSGEMLLDKAFDVLLGTGNSALVPSTRFPTNAMLVGYNTTFFQRFDIMEVPLASASTGLKSQILQTSGDRKFGYAVMHCEGGGSMGSLCTPEKGLHNYIMPASGMFSSLVFESGLG